MGPQFNSRGPTWPVGPGARFGAPAPKSRLAAAGCSWASEDVTEGRQDRMCRAIPRKVWPQAVNEVTETGA